MGGKNSNRNAQQQQAKKPTVLNAQLKAFLLLTAPDSSLNMPTNALAERMNQLGPFAPEMRAVRMAAALSAAGYTGRTMPPVQVVLHKLIVPALNAPSNRLSSADPRISAIQFTGQPPQMASAIVKQGLDLYWVVATAAVDGWSNIGWGAVPPAPNQATFAMLADPVVTFTGALTFIDNDNKINAVGTGIDVCSVARQAKNGNMSAVRQAAQLFCNNKIINAPGNSITPNGLTFEGLEALISWLAVGMKLQKIEPLGAQYDAPAQLA